MGYLSLANSTPNASIESLPFVFLAWTFLFFLPLELCSASVFFLHQYVQRRLTHSRFAHYAISIMSISIGMIILVWTSRSILVSIDDPIGYFLIQERMSCARQQGTWSPPNYGDVQYHCTIRYDDGGKSCVSNPDCRGQCIINNTFPTTEIHYDDKGYIFGKCTYDNGSPCNATILHSPIKEYTPSKEWHDCP